MNESKRIVIVTNEEVGAMLFKFLEMMKDAATETDDVQRRYELNYDFYSKKVDEWGWDEERLRSEYKAACEENNLVLKKTFHQILQDKGWSVEKQIIVNKNLINATKEKAGEIKEDYEKKYDWYSERASDWDDERIKDEYKRACNRNDVTQKMALYKIMQERGMTKD